MSRTARYQAAIIKDQHILLVLHQEHDTGRSYWLLPGGSKEPGESDEECVQREIWEETSLRVQVNGLAMEEPEQGGTVLRRTYLCTPLSGEASPGYEPEPEVAAIYKIASVRWLDLQDENSWDKQVKSDIYTYPELKRLQKILGIHKEAE